MDKQLSSAMAALNADAWDEQMFYIASHGYRAIAHDRRGHGRSARPGTAMIWIPMLTTWCLIEQLDLHDVVLVGHSAGGGEVARYIGRHGTAQLAKVVLVDAIPPLLLKTEANPGGTPIEAFDGQRTGLLADRSQFYKEISAPFYGANRPGSTVSTGVLDALWLWSMPAGLKGVFDGIKAFSETDFTEDLKRFDIPTLIIHGGDDQFVPVNDTALLSSKMVKGAILKIYPGAPHGLPTMHKDQFNKDLLSFLESQA